MTAGSDWFLFVLWVWEMRRDGISRGGGGGVEMSWVHEGMDDRKA